MFVLSSSRALVLNDLQSMCFFVSFDVLAILFGKFLHHLKTIVSLSLIFQLYSLNIYLLDFVYEGFSEKV